MDLLGTRHSLSGQGMSATVERYIAPLTTAELGALHSLACEKMYEMQACGETSGAAFNELKDAAQALRNVLTDGEPLKKAGAGVCGVSGRLMRNR